MQDTPHQMKNLLRNYCFSSLDLCRKRYLKNIALTWVTLGKNNKFDTFHSFQTHYGKIHIFLNVYYILLYTHILLYNVKLQSLQIAPSKSASSLDVFFSTTTLAVIVWNRPNMYNEVKLRFLTNEQKMSIYHLCFVAFIFPFFLQRVRYS